jgi:S1-C subfamily serine protease
MHPYFARAESPALRRRSFFCVRASRVARAPLLLLGALLACAPPAQKKAPETPVAIRTAPSISEDSGVAGAADLSPAQERTWRSELAGRDPAYLGVVDRKGLVVIIDQGLGRLLARLKLSPAMRAGRFEGFRISEIEPAWSGTGLVVGDVLLRVNGQPIERPEQAQVAFESLRVASEIALELLRADDKISLRYRVE